MKLHSSSSESSTPTSLAEINVTPLVDVMLVLLIVFMISAPLMQQGAQVELPKANTGALSEAPDQITLEVTQSKKILMNSKSIKKGTLYRKLRAISQVKPHVQVFIQADRRVDYGFVAQVIAVAKRAQIQRVGLVTQPSDEKVNL